MVYIAPAHIRRAPEPFSFKAVMQRIHDVIAAIEPHDSVERYTGLGVEVLQGYAKIINPWTVEIALNDGGKQTLTTRSIVIAAGARPFVPPLPGLDEVGYVTSDTLWDEFAKLDEVPKRLVVLGGGPIGCELAQSFARLGSAGDPGGNGAAHHGAGRCGSVGTGRQGPARRWRGAADRPQGPALRDGRWRESAGGGARTAWKSALRSTNCCAPWAALRASAATAWKSWASPPTRRCRPTSTCKPSDPNIFAAGDVAGPYQFTHTAAHQAWYAAVNALFGDFKKFKADYSVIPWATFIDPEVARVGLNEQDAKEQGIAYEVTKYGIDDLDRAIADSEAHGFVKVLTVPGKDKILGVTIVGTHAGDLLAEYVLAMKHGLGLNKILGTIHTYPTLAEANKYAAGEWKRAHQPHKLAGMGAQVPRLEARLRNCPHAPPLCGSLPPERARLRLGRPGAANRTPTFRHCACSCTIQRYANTRHAHR